MPEIKEKKLPAKVSYDEPKDIEAPLERDEVFFRVKGVMQNDDLAVGQRVVTINPGDDIQKVIDKVNGNGGGRILLRNGTHTPPSDLTLYSNIYLEGENAGSCIIDFVNNAKGIKVIGTNAYSTGTVSVTNNSTTVTGSGTTFTAGMVGQSILLGGLWYTIAAYSSATSITISAPYANVTLSGATYNIATIKQDVKMTDFTIRTGLVGITLQYTNEMFIRDIDIQTCVTGFSASDASQTSMSETDFAANVTSLSLTNCHYFAIDQTGSIDALSSHGFTLNGVTNSSFSSIFLMNSAADGMNITDSSNIQVGGVFIENAGQGVELVSGNSDISFTNCAFEANGSDGIKLTATTDNLAIMGGSVKDNGGYGLNIAASTCDNNIILGNNFSGNTTAEHTDSGTGTLIRSNIGVTDN